jgi:hypothetical protein
MGDLQSPERLLSHQGERFAFNVSSQGIPRVPGIRLATKIVFAGTNPAYVYFTRLLPGSEWRQRN